MDTCPEHFLPCLLTSHQLSNPLALQFRFTLCHHNHLANRFYCVMLGFNHLLFPDTYRVKNKLFSLEEEPVFIVLATVSLGFHFYVFNSEIHLCFNPTKLIKLIQTSPHFSANVQMYFLIPVMILSI